MKEKTGIEIIDKADLKLLETKKNKNTIVY